LHSSAGERSYYNCFTCGSGGAEELLYILQLYTSPQSYDFNALRGLLADEEAVVPLPPYQEAPTSLAPFEEWPLWWLEDFPSVRYFQQAVDYLITRDMTDEAVDRHKLRYDAKRKMVMCPYFNVFGKFAGVRGRSIVPEATSWKKHHDYTWNGINNAGLVWYNEEVLNLDGPVVCVEGQFDLFKVEQVWPKVVANLTAFPRAYKVRRLADAQLILHIADNDTTGELSSEKYRVMARGLGIKYKRLVLPDSVKDPGECHPNFIHELIQSAL